jgi:hypothetical protein
LGVTPKDIQASCGIDVEPPKPLLVLTHSTLEESKSAALSKMNSSVHMTSGRRIIDRIDSDATTKFTQSSFVFEKKNPTSFGSAMSQKRRESESEGRPHFNVKRSFVDFLKKKQVGGKVESPQRSELSSHRLLKESKSHHVSHESPLAQCDLPDSTLQVSDEIPYSPSAESLLTLPQTDNCPLHEIQEQISNQTKPQEDEEMPVTRPRSSTAERKTIFRRQHTAKVFGK